eukprot:255853_1
MTSRHGLAMSRKKFVTLMLIAIVIHAAAAQDANKVCKAPTFENVFGPLSEQTKYTTSGPHLLNDKRTGCNAGGKLCSTTIDCAEGYYKVGAAIKLWCHPHRDPKSQWSLSKKCLPKVLDFACKFTAGPAIKCDWKNDIPTIPRAKYFLQMFYETSRIPWESERLIAFPKKSTTGATFQFTDSAISTNTIYRAMLWADVMDLANDKLFEKQVRFYTWADVQPLKGADDASKATGPAGGSPGGPGDTERPNVPGDNTN